MPDVTTDFEAGTAGAQMTVADLAASTTGGSGAWNIAGVAANVTTGTESRTGGKCLDVVAANTLTYCNYNFGARYDRCSVGFWFRAFATYQYNTTDVIVLDHDNLDYLVLSWISDPADNPWGLAKLHVAGEPDSPGIQLDHGSWYWVTMQGDGPAQTARMRIFDTALNEVFGTEPQTSTLYAGGQFDWVRWGRCDNHVGTRTGSIEIDDIAIDYTAATYPLMPATGNNMNITMQWNSNPDSPDGYRIKREGPPGTWAQVGADTAATSATVTGASSGENYAVAAYNQYGEGPLSAPVQVGAPPAQVTGLQITAVS